MDKNVKKVNDILVSLFNTVLKMEEEAIKESSDKELSITEVHTLVAIGKGRPKTMSHVANLLEINVSTLTAAINKLVKKGYVERLRDEEDRRIVRIHLTEQGVEIVTSHEKFHDEMVREALSHIPGDELTRFISSIDNINNFMMARSSEAYKRKGKFELKSIKLGANDLPVPIVQAGMGIGIAGSKLASAVAIEGGLGLIGATERGLLELESEVKKTINQVQQAGGKGLIGVSVMWGEPKARKYVETAIRAGAQVIVTSAAIPTDLPKYCAGKRVALVPTISSRRAAAAIIKSWSQKYNRVPDGFIFQGPMAAGLLGFKEIQLDKAEQEQYKTISGIKSELMKLENCPLIVGGGVFCVEDAEKNYRYGADGILLGTRLLLTEECEAPQEYKKLYLNCTANDVTIIKSPMKTSVRALKNDFTSEIAQGGNEDYDIIKAAKKAVEGDYDRGLMFCSANAYKMNEILSVKDVFRQFTEQKGD